MKKSEAIFLIALFMLSACHEIRTGSEPKAMPNIILILSDNIGYFDIGCYGSEIETRQIWAKRTNTIPKPK